MGTKLKACRSVSPGRGSLSMSYDMIELAHVRSQFAHAYPFRDDIG